jgi:hypothetical protein
MIRFILIKYCKFLLYISPFLWRMRGKHSFALHQKIGRIVIRLHHKYKLNLWDDKEEVFF